jgi:hypothetical protein
VSLPDWKSAGGTAKKSKGTIEKPHFVMITMMEITLSQVFQHPARGNIVGSTD